MNTHEHYSSKKTPKNKNRKPQTNKKTQNKEKQKKFKGRSLIACLLHRKICYKVVKQFLFFFGRLE